MNTRVTRQDVARAAGVSGATVSRVYNDPTKVDRATADRVRSCARALGFVPDRNAAALRRRSSGTLLFLEIERPTRYRWASQRYFQSLYGEIIRAILHSLQETPWHLEAITLSSPDQVTRLASGRDFSGILGFDVDDQVTADALRAVGKPVVCCHHGDFLTGVSTVTTNNRLGGLRQAEYLVAQGHSRVAYVTGLRSEVPSHLARWNGFAQVIDPVILRDDVLGYGDGVGAGTSLAPYVQAGTVTAVACVNDVTAWGVVQGLRSQGVSVPEDAVVVGYDNLVLTELLGGDLPTIEAHLPVVYTRAFDMLTKLVDRPSVEQHETVDPELVLPRTSTRS